MSLAVFFFRRQFGIFRLLELQKNKTARPKVREYRFAVEYSYLFSVLDDFLKSSAEALGLGNRVCMVYTYADGSISPCSGQAEGEQNRVFAAL